MQNLFYFIAMLTAIISLAYLLFGLIRKLLSNKEEVSEKLNHLRRL